MHGDLEFQASSRGTTIPEAKSAGISFPALGSVYPQPPWVEYRKGVGYGWRGWREQRGPQNGPARSLDGSPQTGIRSVEAGQILWPGRGLSSAAIAAGVFCEFRRCARKFRRATRWQCLCVLDG